MAGIGGRLDELLLLFTLELLFPKLNFHFDVFFAIVGADAAVVALDIEDADTIEDAYAAASDVAVEVPDGAVDLDVDVETALTLAAEDDEAGNATGYSAPGVGPPAAALGTRAGEASRTAAPAPGIARM